MARYDNYGQLDSREVEAGDSFFNGFNNRLRPDQLQPGELAYSSNGRMDVDGAWQTRKGIDVFGANIGTAGEALIIPFYLYANVNISSASRVNTLVTVTTSTNHGFTDATQVGIAGLTGTVNPNGNRTITVTGLNTFTFTIAGATGSETYGGTATVGAPFIAAVNACYGSCLFSDPSDDNAEYIILATNDKAIAVSLDDASTTNINYPAGITLSANVEMIQAFGKVFIFRQGATALEWNGSFSGTPAFTKVDNGTYAYPTYYDASNNTVIADGVVTVTQTAHGFVVGDQIYVVDKGSSSLTVDAGGYTIASVPTADTFTFYAQVPDLSSHKVVYSKRGSEGRGFTHMPAPGWGVYHQRRLIVPFAYTTTGTSGSEVVTARNVKDEILFSDILDSDTYDVLQNVFKVSAGIADYTQYVHPFTDDNAVAFNRNSIHLISGLSGALTDLSIKEITREAGLVARNSVVTIGNAIYFLSDNGVYATQFGDLYNLRGAGLPLSEAINPVIRRINSDYAHNATAIFHDNRYWLAVPLDSSMVNNAILVYNVLNGKWESVDTVDNVGWDIANFIVAGAGGVNKLYAVNRFGGIHIIDQRVDDVDRIYAQAGSSASIIPIASYATTRQYTIGTREQKKFTDFELQVESTDSNASDARIAFESENMDASATLGTLSDYLGAVLPVSENATINGRIGRYRGFGGQFTFTPTQGRPKLRLTSTTAVLALRATTSVS